MMVRFPPHRSLTSDGWLPAVGVVLGGLWLIGCAISPSAMTLPNRDAMIGKSKQAVLACAGQPVREAAQNRSTILMYYKEATLFEESFFGSKGSSPGVHHGCWASVLLEEDRVTDIGYQSVPSTMDALDECEEIFANCSSSSSLLPFGGIV
ncbi:MAG: hypothetical protein C4293_07845 [Nitrospiraceae bacterium]